MLRMINRKFRKVSLIKLITFCLLGICIIYLVDIKFITSRFTNIKFITSRFTNIKVIAARPADIKLYKLTQKETPRDNNMSVNQVTRNPPVKELTYLNTTSRYRQTQQHDDVDEERHFLNISKNMTALKIIEANNSSVVLTPEVFPTTTSMTFNSNLVVHCKESPYIECLPANLKPITNKLFKITYLVRGAWITEASMDLSRCKFNQCVFDETKVTNDSDIVLVYGVKLPDDFQVGPRWPHQLYIIHGWEPPLPGYTFSDFITNGKSPWNNRFNIIMSYRLDSDIFVPYNRLKFSPKPLDQRPNYYEIAKTKNRTAVWLVSNCEAISKRMDYVKEMQKYLDVDIYGKCGTPCYENSTFCNAWPSTYKFYLSFENSLCTDYVTEKFFKIFDPSIYVIPVVRGGADYDKHFPNFTYINSAHFKTPKDLALHLKHLASDMETYSKYLEYKDLYTLVPDDNVDNMMACKICTYLHTQKLPETTRIYNLTHHLLDGHCYNATDL